MRRYMHWSETKAHNKRFNLFLGLKIVSNDIPYWVPAKTTARSTQILQFFVCHVQFWKDDHSFGLSEMVTNRQDGSLGGEEIA